MMQVADLGPRQSAWLPETRQMPRAEKTRVNGDWPSGTEISTQTLNKAVL